MSKLIIIFGLFLIVIASFAFYQFNNNQTAQVKANGKVTIGNHIINVEVVKDPKAQQIGLTKYPALKEDQGMLFVFDRPDSYGFWMRDMKFPIDIIWVDNNYNIVDVKENAEPCADKCEVYSPGKEAMYVLEVNINSGIMPGDRVEIK